ncbi:hypothetical protein FOQG_19629 [Fusarium oxysporum f. sp. raphani 54005]|uniref:Uncharacterized protein n=1 Tax=Fusarium oxysporum f. sp. raphani 54005 TaxID=1089458 RepID=X0BAS7_FUSOX|nr:hypothetical protein FOQG_19629 [Fusarium oxysporum f. sp. raphani 54005]
MANPLLADCDTSRVGKRWASKFVKRVIFADTTTKEPNAKIERSFGAARFRKTGSLLRPITAGRQTKLA